VVDLLEEQSAEDVLPALRSRVEWAQALRSRLVEERSIVVVEQTCFGWLISFNEFKSLRS